MMKPTKPLPCTDIPFFLEARLEECDRLAGEQGASRVELYFYKDWVARITFGIGVLEERGKTRREAVKNLLKKLRSWKKGD